MKLIFKKDNEARITVLQKTEKGESEFSYVDLIKSLLHSKKLDEAEMSEGFTDAEVKSIKSMVQHINEKLASLADPNKGLGS